MHVIENIFGIFFMLKILYLAKNIKAVIHKDSIINVDDIWSINKFGEIIINDDVLKNINIFIVSRIIINIITCQYILVISGSRSNLETVKMMSSIY